MKALFKRSLLALNSVLFCLTAAVASAEPTTASTTNPATSQAQRLISTDAGATDMIFAFGLDAALVAVDVTTQLPANYRPLAKIGYHRNLSAEGLLSLQPSLIVGSDHMGPAPVLTTLRNAKIPLVQLPSAHTLIQLQDNIEQLGRHTQQQDKAMQLIQQLQQQQQQLQKHALSEQQVIFLLSTDGSKLRQAGHKTAGHAFIELLGASNAANYENYRTVSAEAILAQQADIILLAGQDPSQAAQQLLSNHPALKYSRANKQQRLIAIDGASLVAGLSIKAVAEALETSQQLQRNNVAATNH